MSDLDLWLLKMDSRKRTHELIGEVPKLYSVFNGEVAAVQPYGIFIKIPGCSKNGFVHRSQMSNTLVEQPDEVVTVGEQIFCKVISAEPDGSKIGLSMKVVNQTTGNDLDPTNVQTTLDEKRRQKSFTHGVAPIELDAIYDTTCKKCGGKGHLAQDCFHRPGDKAYELIEDDVPSSSSVADGSHTDTTQKKKKKHHKNKKHRVDKDTHKHQKKHRKEKYSSEKHQHGDHNRHRSDSSDAVKKHSTKDDNRH